MPQDLYRYFCITENDWIKEKVDIDDPVPTVCKNDPGHTIDSTTIHIFKRAKRKSEFGLENVQNIKDNVAGSVAPTVSDDISAGYTPGSRWVNKTNDEVYFCVSAEKGAAIWQKATENVIGVNIGTSGIGIYKEKNNETLEFKKLNPKSDKLSIEEHTSGNRIDLDIIENNIDVNNLANTPSGQIIGTTDIQTLTNKTINSTNNTILLNASTVTSGTFANARISSSSVTQHQDLIDHNSLANYVQNQHLDWTQDQGSNNIHPNNITSEAVTQFQGSINHDSLTGIIANQHIDHSTVSILPGQGLSGGGTITQNRTLALNLNSLTEDTNPDTASDYIVTYDVSQGSHKKVLIDNLPSSSTGEANLAQNVGTSGIGIWKDKTGTTLNFKKINAGSNKITLTDDTLNSEVKIDLVESNINIDNLLNSPSSGVVGLTDTQTLTNKTLTSPILTSPQIYDASEDHQYVFDTPELTGNRTVSLPLLTGNDTFVFENFPQTLSNKNINALNNSITGLDKTDVGLGNVENSKMNLNAITDPTGSDDSNSGYSVGSVWVNVSSDKAFICVDATISSAIWQDITVGSGGTVTTFDAYDSTGNQTFTTGTIVLNLDTERKNTGHFTLTSDVLTVNTGGTYVITCRVTTDITSGAARSTSKFWLERNTGTGFTEVTGSRGHMYNREANNGENTATVVIIKDISAGHQFRIMINRETGSDTMTTVAGGSSLTLFNLNNASGTAGGEANTGSSVGSGVGIFKTKTNTNLEFKSLTSSPGLNVTDNGETVNMALDINALTNDSNPNVSTDYLLFYDTSSGTHEKTLISNIQTVAQNLGSGEEVYHGRSGNTVQFKSLVPGSNVSLNSDSNTVTINSTVGMNWRGTWTSQNYVIDDVVEHGGSCYICILDTTSNQPPTIDMYWDLVTQKGNDGADGSGTSMIFREDGINVPNTPHSIFNFVGDFALTDAGSGVINIRNDPKYFYAYDVNGLTAIYNGWTDLPWDTEGRKDSVYTHDPDSAEISFSITSWYEIQFDISAESTSGSSRSQAEIRVLEDTGSGYTEIPGTRATLYIRTSAYGASATIKFIRQIVAGTKIKIQGDNTVGSSQTKTLPNGCRVLIKSI